MEIKIKKLSPNATIPTQSHTGDAGYDLYACDIPGGMVEIQPHKTIKISTGLAMSFPDGYAALLLPRSGVATKRSLRPANTPGLIEGIYTGPWICAMHNDSEEVQTVTEGERIAQVIFVPVLKALFTEVDELEETERGTGGFGSTGTR